VRLARPVACLLTLALVGVAPAASSAPSENAPDPRPAFGGLDSPIRPGSHVTTSVGSCTLNFVFYDSVLDEGQVPAAYVGTAAHCTQRAGDRVTVPGVGEIGTVVYDSDHAGSGADFALIRIDDELVGRTNPQVRGFTGPTGSVTTADLGHGDLVDVYGYGVVFGRGEQTRPRRGVLMNWDESEYAINMPAVNGDSGGPVLHSSTGKALGIVSRYGFAAMPPSTDQGPLMTYVFRALDDAGFGDVVLATVDA
jgi:hypothetical protein